MGVQEITCDTRRDTQGRFGLGTKFGRGNPLARRVQELRQSFINEGLRLIEGEAADDLRTRMDRVAGAMFDRAESGDVAAARLCADYSIGKPKPIAEGDGGLEEFRFKFVDQPLENDPIADGNNTSG